MNIQRFIYLLFIFKVILCEDDGGWSSNGRTTSGTYSYNIDFIENAFKGDFGNKIRVKQADVGFGKVLKKQKSNFPRLARTQSHFKNTKSFFPPIFQNITQLIPFTKQDAVNISFPVNNEDRQVQIPPQSNIAQQNQNTDNIGTQDYKSHIVTNGNKTLNLSVTQTSQKSCNLSTLDSKFEGDIKTNPLTGISNVVPSPQYKVPAVVPVLLLQPFTQAQYSEQPRYYSHTIPALSSQNNVQPVEHILLQSIPFPPSSSEGSYPVSYDTPSPHYSPAPAPVAYSTSQTPSYIMVIHPSTSLPTHQSVVDSVLNSPAALPKQEIVYQHPLPHQQQQNYYPVSPPEYYAPPVSKDTLSTVNVGHEDGIYATNTPNTGTSYVVHQNDGPDAHDTLQYRVPQETHLSIQQVLKHVPVSGVDQYVHAAESGYALALYKSTAHPKTHDDVPINSSNGGYTYEYVASGSPNESILIIN